MSRIHQEYFCQIRGSDRDFHLNFCRVPRVKKNQEVDEEERSRERRRCWIAAINCKDIDKKKIIEGRVCERHVVKGNRAASWDQFNVDWVPTVDASAEATVEANNAREERTKERKKRKLEQQELEMEEKCQRLNEPGDSVRD